MFFFTGSISSEKSKMLDITRDKPIKVAVRVAVPVRDHPKVQFSIKSCYLMCSHIYMLIKTWKHFLFAVFFSFPRRIHYIFFLYLFSLFGSLLLFFVVQILWPKIFLRAILETQENVSLQRRKRLFIYKKIFMKSLWTEFKNNSTHHTYNIKYHHLLCAYSHIF